MNRSVVVFALLAAAFCGISCDAEPDAALQPCTRTPEDVVAEIRAYGRAHNKCEVDADCVAVGIFEGDCNGSGRELAVAVNPDAKAGAQRLIDQAEACGFVPNGFQDDFYLGTAYCDRDIGSCLLDVYGRCFPPSLCERGAENVLREIEDYVAQNADCTTAADCVIAGYQRDTCDCALDYVVSVNASAADVANNMIHEAADCGFVPMVCDDIDSWSATCEQNRCGKVSELHSCLPPPPADAAPNPDAAPDPDAGTAPAAHGGQSWRVGNAR
ncbi:MAG TPA: hypothetical protein VFG83_10055 [Kofleriaceae bacterium]|nr:hypothetical protein [Kofleriaceae bacterium]